MSWYDSKSSGWYRPNAVPRTGSAVQSGAPATPPPRMKNTRITALIICLLIVAASVVFVLLGLGARVTEFNDDGNPKDWHDYMDRVYGGSTPTSAVDVKLPTVSDRGSLTLRMGAGSGTLDFSTIYEKCSPSVVGIKVFKGSDNDYFAWGTGVIASENGYIITNTHVIDGGETAKVVLSGGKEYDALLVGFDASSDVALLKIDAAGLPSAEFASSSTLMVGDSVAAIGNPLGQNLSLTMTRGIVSALNREISYNGTTMSLIQTDASINEGNSGGPLFNERGQVVGITNMKMISNLGSGIEGLGFAIPSDTVKSIVSALIADGKVTGRITIGVTVGPVSEYAAKYYDIPQGLYVSYVTTGSDAEKQGIEAGDIIVAVNGKDAFTTQAVTEAKEGLKIGDSIEFTVWRDGKTFTANVKLMDASDMGSK